MLNFVWNRLSFNMILNIFFLQDHPAENHVIQLLTSTYSEKGFFIVSIVFKPGC